ncbi:MAG TPA: hypothetical protein PKH80_05805 [Methanofastidiosum sp.]|nr:hypothetical protein [Methanofastidiosum sp.]HNU61542.1 hypothetical protein [Methanofastidiosum sp.]
MGNDDLVDIIIIYLLVCIAIIFIVAIGYFYKIPFFLDLFDILSEIGALVQKALITLFFIFSKSVIVILKEISKYDYITLPYLGYVPLLELIPLWIIGFIVEIHYKSRTVFLSNAIVLLIGFKSIIFRDIIIEMLIYDYILICFILGIGGWICYFKNISWKKYHYDIFGILYSTFIILGLIIFRNIIASVSLSDVYNMSLSLFVIPLNYPPHFLQFLL